MMVRASVTCRIWRDGVCVSTWRTVTSVMEVVVRRQAVVRWGGAVARSDAPRPPGPSVGVSPGMRVMAEAKVNCESLLMICTCV